MTEQMDIQSYLEAKGAAAVAASRQLALTSSGLRNQALRGMAAALLSRSAEILAANAADLEAAKAAGTSGAMLDRLRLDDKRIAEMAKGLDEVAALADPLGEVMRGWRMPNGLEIRKIRVPLGVIGIIYEARPNVTVDAAALCLKTANACLLRGGSEAIRSNLALAAILAGAAAEAGLPVASVQLVERTDRETAKAMMRLNKYLDVLIPRGGAGLIQTVVREATVPVIETGIGNCHAFVDASADLEMAARIIDNGKTQRPAVCNALETVLVHEAVAPRFLPRMAAILGRKGVELRGCAKTLEILHPCTPATDADWDTEFLDLILAVKIVGSLDEAIEHIARHGTKHSETIITRDLDNARRFQREVDAAAVYVNASTRFTDGGQFGFGAEIGISTQKLHARGPMGLTELTTCKYLVDGDGQVR